MTEAYPLWWPDGWPRTAPGARENDHRFHGKSYRLNMGRARDQLLAELRLLGAKGLVVSTNVELRLDGLPYSETRHIADPGVAVYFTLDGEQLVMARDQFVTVAGNLRTLTLAVEAMRQLERHGGRMMMKRARHSVNLQTGPAPAPRSTGLIAKRLAYAIPMQAAATP
jgi:hypothetical protein